MYGSAKGLTKPRAVKIYKLGPYRMLETQLVALGLNPDLIKTLQEDLNPWAKPSQGIDLKLIRKEMELGLRRKELEKLSKSPKENDTKGDD